MSFFVIIILVISMLIKSNAIDRFLRENPQLSERRFGLPLVGNRLDMERFNPTVEKIADAINFYGYEVRDSEITTKKDSKAKSLSVLMSKYTVPQGIRVTENNFSTKKDIRYIPIYAMFCLNENQ